MTNPFTEIEKQLTEISLKLDALVTPGNNQPEYLTIDQAAEFLKLSKGAIYKRTMNETIPFQRNGRKLLFRRSDLMLWVNNQTPQRKAFQGVTIER
jgi:excisionase family DNA binding protein